MAQTNEPLSTDFPSQKTARPRTASEALALNRVVIAHAGGDFEAPHSTLFAFKEALRKGAHVLEMDVQLAKDGVLIVQHDDTVARTTNSSARVADLTSTELAALDNAYWFHPGCWSCHDDNHPYRGIRTGSLKPPAGYSREDFGITSLETVLTTFPDTVIDIEIKGDKAAGIALARLLADKKAENRVIVVAFNEAVIRDFAQRAPKVITSPGWLTTAGIVADPQKKLVGQKVIQVPPKLLGRDVLTPALLAAAKKNNVAVWVWADEQRDEDGAWYRNLLGKGVRGIIASRPGVLAAATSENT
jgi:glycerophosphoryl diester phosphodiesterase